MGAEADEYYAEKRNNELGIQVQHRFDFYTVALAFTILGLAVQTGRFGGLWAADLAELVGWCCLLWSGWSGLRRIKELPVMYHRYSLQAESERIREEIPARTRGPGTMIVDGRSLTQAEAGQYFAERLGKIEGMIRESDQRVEFLERHQHTFLGSGMAMLVIARGLPPLLNLLEPLIRFLSRVVAG